MKQKDIEYLVTNLGNLTGIPVRLYKEKKKVYYYSLIHLSTDPIILHENEVFKTNDHVSYFLDSFFFYYGIISFNNYKIVIGPARQVTLSDQELKDYAFRLSVNNNDIDDFIKNIKAIVAMPLSSLLQTLCMTNFVLNKGEKLSLKDIHIYDREQEMITRKLEIEDIKQTMDNQVGDNEFTHNTYNVEQTIANFVRKGEVSLLKEYFSKLPGLRAGITSKDFTRQYINMFIVTATIISRAAISGGLDIDEALSLSDKYIQKCELEKSVSSIINLQYRMVIDYCERVEKLKYGETTSKLVSDVINYVRHNLSKPITTEEIADHLYMSRSYLSTKFKEETSENLYTFITKMKIDEAKRLLRYTDKSLALIATYLGYSSQSHFARVFKTYTTLTPNEYRDKF